MPSSRSTLRHLVPVMLLACPAAALAQDAATAQQPIVLDEIVLSGGIFPVEAQAYGRAYSVITADDIATRGTTSLQDALRGVPGVSVTSTGETLTAVRVRGGEPNHVLVLIDGVEANDAGSGGYLFSGMSLDNIDRIEVLRGPQSALYGANAASGVINVITRKADQRGLHATATAEVGGNATRNASATISHAGPRGGLSLALAARRTDGEDGSRTQGGDTEFNDNDTVSLRGDYRLTDTVSTGFTLRRIWQEYGYDGARSAVGNRPADYVIDAPLTARRDQSFGSVWIEAEAMGGRMLNRLALSAMAQDHAHSNAGTATYDDESRQRALKYSGSFALDGSEAASADQRLNVALEAERESYRASFSGTDRYRRDTRAAAVEYQGRFAGGLDVQAGLRREFNDVFADATTWNLSAAYQLPDHDLRLRGAIGKAIVNPTMFEQYGYIPGTFEGNPDLRPETTRGAELGLDYGLAGGRGTLGVTLFHNRVDDLITGAGDSSVNLPGTSTRKGAELSLAMQATDQLRVAASYTYTDATDQDGARLNRVPRHELSLQAVAETFGGRGWASVDIRHVAGHSDLTWYDSPYPATPVARELPDFTAVNVAASYDLNDRVALTGRVVNLLDTDNSEAWGYYGQGRTAYVGLQAKW